jgi:hypothetical protein
VGRNKAPGDQRIANCVRLTLKEWNRLRVIGRGNLSAGIRYLLEQNPKTK